MNSTINIVSPVTGSKNVKLIDEIDSSSIITRYSSDLNFDATNYFRDIEKIKLYECLDTSYRFYFPYSLQGREDLYNHLEHFEFYYLQNRWEFKIPPIYARPDSKLLEIGCGNGYSLSLLKEKGIDCTGLELNKEAIKVCEANGLKVFNQTIEEFSNDYSEKFDIICAFQLLEHLSDINGFITASLKLLNNNGNLIISVPNNDSFGHKYNTLNLPPHHMGIWNKKSLSSLSKYFSIEVKKIYYTPLDKVQKADFKLHYKNIYGKLPLGIRSISRFSGIFKFLVPKHKKGYTIVVVFQKK